MGNSSTGWRQDLSGLLSSIQGEGQDSSLLLIFRKATFPQKPSPHSGTTWSPSKNIPYGNAGICCLISHFITRTWICSATFEYWSVYTLHSFSGEKIWGSKECTKMQFLNKVGKIIIGVSEGSVITLLCSSKIYWLFSEDPSVEMCW